MAQSTRDDQKPPAADEKWMSLALQLAQRGRGWVEPNPMVGAVIVRDGRVIGQGHHARFGQAHAEVAALADCASRGEQPAGATMYVTLEPCAHEGKTPACANALIDAKLGRVVVAMIDPFEQVAGRGMAMIEAAGIATTLGVLEASARQLNEAFIKRVRTRLPWVTLKWAQTVDGKIAAATGDSRWISSPASRHRVHELRAQVDAIVVGIGTALADNPQLTARDVEVRRTARRVLVDANLQAGPALHLIAQPTPAVTIATHARHLASGHEKVRQWHEKGIEVLGLPRDAEGRLVLRALLEHLGQAHDATRVLVEGGAGLAGALLAEGLVDELLVFIAPKLLGDAAGISAVRGQSVTSIAGALRLTLRTVEQIDEDVLLHYLLAPAPDRP